MGEATGNPERPSRSQAGRSRKSSERPGDERNDANVDEAPSGRTVTKTVRATSNEIQRVNELLPSMPEAGTEAGALRLLLLDGLQLREAAVVAAGGKLPDGVSMPQLVAALAQRVLPVLPLLARHGMIPQMFGAMQSTTADAQPSTPAPTSSAADEIDESAAEDVGGMGAGLL